MAQPTTFTVLQTRFSAISHAVLAQTVEDWSRQDGTQVVCFSDTHSVVSGHDDLTMQRALESADIVCPDGYPLAFIGRKLFRLQAARVCGSDFLDYLAARPSASNLRHYFFGGAPGVVEDMVVALHGKYPQMIVAGTATPPMGASSAAELDAQIAQIIAAKPDLVWVGLGAPKQEIWMANNRNRLPGMTLLGVGAAFDFQAGRKARAPRWMQENGLEWLFRCASEPRRLVPRYGRVIPRFAWLVGLHVVRTQLARWQDARRAKSSGQA